VRLTRKSEGIGGVVVFSPACLSEGVARQAAHQAQGTGTHPHSENPATHQIHNPVSESLVAETWRYPRLQYSRVLG
jgi:hypothetical protein